MNSDTLGMYNPISIDLELDALNAIRARFETQLSSDDSRYSTRIEYLDAQFGTHPDAPTIRVGFIPSAWKTLLDGSGNAIATPIPPQYITHIEKGNKEAALNSLKTEGQLDMVSRMAVRARLQEACIAVSANVLPGTFQIDWAPDPTNPDRMVPERIVINEAWAAARALDADGDRGGVVMNSDWSKAVLVKYPITKRVPIISFVRGHVAENLGNLDTATLLKAYLDHPYERGDERALFDKGHTSLDIGPKTSAHNVMDCWRVRVRRVTDPNYMPMDGKGRRSLIFRNSARYDEIERNGMKSRTKEGTNLVEASALDFKWKLSPKYAWALTSSGQITKAGDPEIRDWFLKTDLDKLASRISNLELVEDDFIPKKSQPIAGPIPDTYIQDNKLIDRMMAAGRLRILTHFPMANPEVFPFDPNNARAGLPCIVLVSTLPDGQIVAFQDVKRDNGQREGLSYAFVLTPVWVANLGRYVHPLDHLAMEFETRVQFHFDPETGFTTRKVVSRFDSCILNPVTGQVANLFGSQLDWKNNYVDHWVNYPGRVVGLMTAFTEYMGKCGRAIGARRTPNGIRLNPIAREYTSATVLVDYSEPSTADQMWSKLDQAHQVHPLCRPGNKQSGRRFRRYALSNNVGRPIYSKPYANARRAGNQCSQLIQGVRREMFKVAISVTDTETQFFITPSGISLQTSPDCFLPKVFNTLKEWQQYCDENGLDDLDPTICQVIDYPNSMGQMQRVWTTTPRACAEVGKLVDVVGNKGVPRRIPQLTTINPDGSESNIDLLLPLQEIINKGALHAMLGKEPDPSKIQTVLEPVYDESGHLIGYNSHQMFVLDWEFIRTGAASENIPGRSRIGVFKGMDGLAIQSALEEMDPVRHALHKPDLTYSKYLQTTAQILNRLTPRNSAFRD